MDTIGELSHKMCDTFRSTKPIIYAHVHIYIYIYIYSVISVVLTTQLGTISDIAVGQHESFWVYHEIRCADLWPKR